jgi:hypothetical protein
MSRKPRSLLSPERAVLRARDLLVRQGLREVARSSGNDSFYLRLGDTSQDLRISNHRRTPGRRRQYPNVIHSLIFDEPRSDRQVELATEEALRDYRRLLDRLAGRTMDESPRAH